MVIPVSRLWRRARRCRSHSRQAGRCSVTTQEPPSRADNGRPCTARDRRHHRDGPVAEPWDITPPRDQCRTCARSIGAPEPCPRPRAAPSETWCCMTEARSTDLEVERLEPSSSSMGQSNTATSTAMAGPVTLFKGRKGAARARTGIWRFCSSEATAEAVLWLKDSEEC